MKTTLFSHPMRPYDFDWEAIEAGWGSLQTTSSIGPPRPDGNVAVIALDQSISLPDSCSTACLVTGSTIQSNLAPASENAAQPHPLIATRPEEISGSKSPMTKKAVPAGPTVYSTAAHANLDSRCHFSSAEMAGSNERISDCVNSGSPADSDLPFAPSSHFLPEVV